MGVSKATALRPGIAIVALAGLVAVQLAFAPSASAQVLIGEAEATAGIERDYGVEVLGVEEDTVGGTPVFRITVMNPAGDFNEAFLVSTLIVDRRTGELVPQYRQGSQGAELPGPARRAGD